MLLLNARSALLINSVLLFVYTSVGENKYSAQANEPKHADSSPLSASLRNLDKPFRMAKLNIVWIKAKNVSNEMCELKSTFVCILPHVYIINHLSASASDGFQAAVDLQRSEDP